ncbi:MAG: Asp-tRNA(Asn)/Glu-tRNA(Gln) amidotransferase subunit GatC [Calditrichaeota bacterium]|nr:Asp-tRNA(Asn)/Glu-tRNA(Gln) amidotransferase subunit GatC [Calditrichota bacterium]
MRGYKLKVTPDEVGHIADLARLCPSVDEKLRLAEQMSQIVEFVEQLNELDTSDVEPLHHVLDLHSVLREDEPQPSLPVDEALMNAPARKGDYFRVPRVIEKG